MGQLANALLTENKKLYVCARTSKTVFLDCEGELLWIVTPEAPIHRRALIAKEIPNWPPDASLSLENQTIADQTGEVLVLRKYVIWKPEKLVPPHPSIKVLASTMLKEFSAYFQTVLDVMSGEWLENFFQACKNGNEQEILSLGYDVVGCGPGLTPLADDFLGGVFFALANCGFFISKASVERMVEGRTTRVSFVMLSDSSQGHGPEPLHSLAAALFRGSLEDGKTCAQRLLKLGHTTGTGLLFGALTVWSLWPAKKGVTSGEHQGTYRGSQ